MAFHLAFYCTSCFRSARHFAGSKPDSGLVRLGQGLALCKYCQEDLAQITIAKAARRSIETSITSLYHYRDVMRQLILRAKVRGDQRAVALLLKLAMDRMETQRVAAACDIIIAGPSSLWGRLRGRLDLAAVFAAALAECYNKALVPAPYDMHWRLQKQARAASSQRRKRRSLKHASRWQRLLRTYWMQRHARSCCKHSILIVDDVTTSGWTIHSLTKALARTEPREVHTLTLARSGDG